MCGYVGVGVWACVGVWVFKCKLSQLLDFLLPLDHRPDSLTRLLLFDNSQGRIRLAHSPGASTVVGRMFLVRSTLAPLPVRGVHSG